PSDCIVGRQEAATDASILVPTGQDGADQSGRAHRLNDSMLGQASDQGPYKGRFPWKDQFLHEVGWVLNRISGYPSMKAVETQFDNEHEVEAVPAATMKNMTVRWFTGS